MVIEDPVELSIVSWFFVQVVVVFLGFWKGRFIVNTFVFEPNAPSMDIVSHEGWDAIVVVVVNAVDTTVLLLDVRDDADVDP